eukprot:1142911-Pyramimonas_sp.AAC.1
MVRRARVPPDPGRGLGIAGGAPARGVPVVRWRRGLPPAPDRVLCRHGGPPGGGACRVGPAEGRALAVGAAGHAGRGRASCQGAADR